MRLAAAMTAAAYRVAAVRSGDWWEIEITSGLPDNVLGVSQARSLAEVEDVARNLVAELLEGNPDHVDVEVDVVKPSDIPA